MKFYSFNGQERPVRLSDRTRAFANDSLNYKYGLDTRKTNAVSLDDLEDYETMSQLERYDAAISKIVREAPVRICDGERISGAATLGAAIGHCVPAVYQGKAICSGISHLTIDFETVLKQGMNYIRRKVQRSLEIYRGSNREAFLKSCMHCLDSFDFWHGRYLKALEDLPEYTENYWNLQRVPHQPASNFYEAVQSLWFTFAFVRLCGNWPGIGRIDVLLGDYLDEDLTSGRLTLGEAREILAHFFIKGCEWISGGNYISGDAQHYQNILLAGIDETGKEITNSVTYLVLDILEELGISDFPTTVRLNKNTDERLLRRVAQVMRYGGGTLAVYNEDLVIDSLIGYGYPLEAARKFANDGCWEVQIPGETFFNYIPFDSLEILQTQTLKKYEEKLDFPDFASLYKKYVEDLHTAIMEIGHQAQSDFEHTDVPAKDWNWQPKMPCTIVSLFEKGCIEKGRSYLEGGCTYNIRSPHIGGLADTVNSLYAIKKLVYEEKRLTLPEFLCILKNNWEGEEVLRRYLLRRYSYFGNDNDEVDCLAVKLLDDFADCCDSLAGCCGYRFPAGVSTFGRQLEWAPLRLASAHGRKKGEVLAANCSPTPGTDIQGATAIIRSYCKANLKRMVTGAALDIKLMPTSISQEEGLQALISLMRGFVSLGGFFMQLDVVDAEVLREAQEHPENYQTLSVRVSGWNARFVTLSREWQDMIISQKDQ